MQSHTERKDNEKTPGVSGLSVSDALPLCDGSGGDFHDKRKSAAGVCTEVYFGTSETYCERRGAELSGAEYSLSVYLKQVCLTVGSEQIPIENIKVYLNKEEQIRIGMFLRVCGKLEEIPGSRNPGEFDSKQYYACQKIYYR